MVTNRRRAFTLIELLVVISIIGTLSSVVLAAMSGAREKSRVGGAILFSTHMYRAFGADALGLWSLDEPNNDDPALDSSGNGITLTRGASNALNRAACVPYNSAGRCVNLVGSSYMYYGTKTAINTTTRGTASAWIKTSQNDATKMIGVFSTNATAYAAPGFNLFIQSGVLKTTQMNTVTISSSKFISDNIWHHVALSFNDGATDGIRIYVDGIEVAKGTLTYGQGNNIYIGVFKDYYVGSIDEIAIYPYSVTAAEVRSIYAEGLPRHNDLAVK